MSTVQEIASMMEYLTDNPFMMKSENEFYASIDRGIAQADAGQVQDIDEAVDEISAELGIQET